VTSERAGSQFDEIRERLPEALPEFLLRQRWFGSKGRRIRSVEIVESVRVPRDDMTAAFFLIRVSYMEGAAEIYSLPLAVASGEQTAAMNVGEWKAPALRLDGQNPVTVYDALWDRDFAAWLLQAMASSSVLQGAAGEIHASETPVLRRHWDPAGAPLDPALMKAEQSNTSIIFGGRLVLKFFRRLEEGINPDLEVGSFLTTRTRFTHIAPVAGALEYRRPRGKLMTLAMLQEFVPNQGDAWKYTLSVLERYFKSAADAATGLRESATPDVALLELCRRNPPSEMGEFAGDYLRAAQLLGERTAELHLALASDASDPDFAPEPYTESNRQALCDSMRDLAARVFRLLRDRMNYLSPELQQEGQKVLAREADVMEIFLGLPGRKISALRTRIHGDYHLGQVLYTGNDFVIIDFEGEPARTLEERRVKRSPIQDVAGMLRSFHYAAFTGLNRHRTNESGGAEEAVLLEGWGRAWHLWVSAAFLKSYLRVAGSSAFLPQAEDELELLLKAFLLEKAVYELGYELNNRPDWVRLPMQGILQLLKAPG
jgi:maltose alpha-D-glucosyltransferase / alpha-amylase